MRLEKCLRKRTCHNCRVSVPKGEELMATYSKSTYGWWSERTNTCFICLEKTVRKIKKSIRAVSYTHLRAHET